MIRLIQYLVLAFLIGNGMQPLLVEAGLITADLIDTVSQDLQHDDCDTEDADKSESSDDDLSEKPRRIIKEPKPHDLDFSSPSSSVDIELAEVVVPVCLEGRKLSLSDRLPKISMTLKRRTYFSKSVSHSHPIS